MKKKKIEAFIIEIIASLLNDIFIEKEGTKK